MCPVVNGADVSSKNSTLPQASNPTRPQATLQMIERLNAIHQQAQAHPEAHSFMSEELAEYYRVALNQALNDRDLSKIVQIYPQRVLHLLQAGRSEVALQELNGFESLCQQVGHRLDSRKQLQLGLYRALCHLRIGEQENCLAHHTSESCLLPIRTAGVHALPRGSLGAVDVLESHLTRFRNDLQARWLLNIAHMTLGQYPDNVPSPWLIPPSVFASEHDIGRFPDVAPALGLDVDALSGGSIVEDFNGDGLLDVLVSSWSLDESLRLFINRGNGSFQEHSQQAGLSGLTGGLNLVHADYNNDGFPDILVLRGAWLEASGRHPNSLLRNNGDGTFEDVTEAAGLLSLYPTQTAVWFDFNGDGWLDLFIGNESVGDNSHPCELYRNNGDGTFTECAAESGLQVHAFVKGVVSGDYNNNGRPDLYLSVRDGPNLLFRNDGPADGTTSASTSSKPPGPGTPRSAPSRVPWKFTDTTQLAGVAEPNFSFPAWFWDYDNDGWLDLFVTGYRIRHSGDIAADYLGQPHSAELPRLYRNRGDGTFEEVSKAMGLDKVLHAMGANFGDLDNDGWLDFYVATGDPDLATLIPNRMFRNANGKAFQDITTSGGFGHIQKGHAVSFADIDNDGDVDVHVNIGGAYSGDNYRNVLFLNPGHNNRWITLKLEGIQSNRSAIGARIRVEIETEDPARPRSIYRTVSSGGSFGGSPLRQEIGLGQAKSIRQIEISWPATGRTQVLKGLDIDRFYHVRENDPKPTQLSFPTFRVEQ